MQVELRDIRKSFGRLTVIDGVSLEIEEGHLFTLLGPSGCGKTTLLKIVAGFHAPDAGQVLFGGTRVNAVPPHKRETGMVFQTYALFPHLTVFDNVAYGLRTRRTPQDQIRKKVAEVLENVQLDGLEARFPSQLSGGQQQRVALARALVFSPRILLMDEPLSNLDARLRISMREEIKRIQKRLGITTIYVTHDQEEAMAISDRVAILNGGRLEQIGTPWEIYAAPRNRFVAQFMGSSNILDLDVTGYDAGRARAQARTGDQVFHLCSGKPLSGPILVALRPEWIDILPDGAEAPVNAFTGTVVSAMFVGSLVRYGVRCLGDRLLTIDAADPHKRGIKGEGEPIRLGFDAERPVVIEP